MTKTKKSDRFPSTKELVRIALNDGMTQIEIARRCRTQQPQVSKWKSGSTLATREQLKDLLELYGEKLRRTSFKLYQTRHQPSQPAQFVRVEGKLILREKFRGTGRTGDVNSPTALRISIHDQKKAGFVLVIEITNAGFPDRANKSWTHPMITDRHAAWFLNDGVEGIKRHSLENLVLRSRDLGHGDSSNQFPGLAQLPFLLTEALLNQGFDVKDIVEFKTSL